MIGNYKVKAPIGGVGIRQKDTSDKGILFEVTDGNDYSVYPCLPGIVSKIDDEEVTIKHKDYVGKDFISIYEIDGKIKVKEKQEVTQSTVIGKTDEEVIFKVKDGGSYTSAKDFIGKEFGKTKETTLSSKQKARCIARSIVGLPAKAFGVDEYDPCAEFYGDKSKKPSEPVDTEIKKDKKNNNKNNDGENDGENDGGEKYKDIDPSKSLPDATGGEEEKDGPPLLGSGVKLIESVTESKELNEEISRIKELLRL
jgi:hypothetical protein